MLKLIPYQAGVAAGGQEDAIVAAAQADPAAFAAIYERYLPQIYRYLAARSSPDDAADLSQVVFLKAFDALGRYRPGPTPFASWLFRIARNVAVDAHRRSRPLVPLELLPDLEPDGDTSPEVAQLRAERLRELRAVVAALDPSRRDLLALRYAGGLTVAEIAPLVGKSPDAVKKQLQRILRDLKEHYRADPR